jgi:hypothetical protein
MLRGLIWIKSRTRIFLSYRREDSQWAALLLYEQLSQSFGANRIFMDVGIKPGVDFHQAIEEAIARCDILIAVIGNQWSTITDENGKMRLSDPDDFVRLEISSALKRGITVVPILVDGAKMPRATSLPQELAELTRRQALEIVSVRLFRYVIDELVTTIESTNARRDQKHHR